MLKLLAALMFPLFVQAQAPSATPKSPDRRKEVGAKALGVLKYAMDHDDSDIRALLAEQWGEIGSSAALPALQKALHDSNSYVRIAAAKSLYRLGDKSGLAELLNIVKKRPKSRSESDAASAIEQLKAIQRDKVRVAALRALVSLDPKGVSKILNWAKRDPSGSVQDAAAIALAHLGHDEEASRFVEALNSEDENERLVGVWSLGEIATPAVVEPLRTKLRDPAYHVRAAALQALGSAGDLDSLPDLEAATRDGSDYVRAKAVEALGRLKSQEAAACLKEVVEKSTNAYIQLMAMSGLADLRVPADLHLAQRSLAQPDFDTRMLAVEVLEAIGVSPGAAQISPGGRTQREQAADMLEFALEDPQMKVRVRAAAALIKLLKKT